MGTAYKKTDAVVKTILQQLEVGNTRTAAAATAGVSLSTFSRWFTEDADFSESVTRAEGKAESSMAQRLFNAADMDWRAAERWLKMRRPSDWTDIDPLDQLIKSHDIEIKALQLRAERVALAAALATAKTNNIPTDPDEAEAKP